MQTMMTRLKEKTLASSGYSGQLKDNIGMARIAAPAARDVTQKAFDKAISILVPRGVRSKHCQLRQATKDCMMHLEKP